MQLLNIFVRMKSIEFLLRGSARQIHIHGVVHAVRHNELVGEGQAPGLHGMVGAEVVVFDFGVGVVRDRVAFGPLDAVHDFGCCYGGRDVETGGRHGAGVVFADSGRHFVGGFMRS